MIRKPAYQLLAAEYDIYHDERSDEKIGHAIVVGGVIEKIAVKEDIGEAFTGQILSTMMTNIVTEADRISSNLAIRVVDNETIRMKRFLERFGFRQTGVHVFKRIAGSIRPPGVLY